MAIRCWYSLVLATTLVTSPALAGDPPINPDEEFPGNRYVKVRLALEETALTPGKGGHLGVIFDISKDWHVYWRYAGDSGLPPRVDFKLPSGVTIGAALWPAPKRHVEPGDLVDYIFENQLVLMYPITVSEGAVLGSKAAIRADVDWLVCRDVCVPGRATATAEFGIASSSKVSPEAAIFANARARHPVAEGRTAPYTAEWSGRNLVIKFKGARRLVFCPYENDAGVYPDNMHRDGEVKSDTLRISYPEEVQTLKTIRGLLAVERDGKETFHEVQAAPPES
ncbi:MAG TPA: protein-disulfide reductase DsbD domain-containing protein [Phycisphaerae bacterium]|nr:protein-disulfide reductase DsbD domain-containing protein [Phycisphaerae bacterium]